MQTHFDKTALQRPEIQMADDILRKCVHCGFVPQPVLPLC
mgnify:CR=1 FL=1